MMTNSTFSFILSRLIILSMRNVSDKSCRGNQNTRFGFSKLAPPSRQVVPFMRLMWKNIVEPERSQVAIRHMRFACCITKATDTHSEYVILVAFQ